MATHDGNSPIGRMIEQLLVQKGINIAAAGEPSGVAGKWSGKTMHMSFTAAS
jgi:hypothetical protein